MPAIVNARLYPICSMSRRKIRTHRAWNVETQTSCADSPNSLPTRSRISRAALFVNVIAKTFQGWPLALQLNKLPGASIHGSSPEPAPAIISSGPSVSKTASCCLSFIPANRLSFDTLFATLSKNQSPNIIANFGRDCCTLRSASHTKIAVFPLSVTPMLILQLLLFTGNELTAILRNFK